jgi:hypothetical protein
MYMADIVVDHNPDPHFYHDHDHGLEPDLVCCRTAALKPKRVQEWKRVRVALTLPIVERRLLHVKFQTHGRVCAVNVDSVVNRAKTLFVPMRFPILFPRRKLPASASASAIFWVLKLTGLTCVGKTDDGRETCFF